MKVVEGYIRDVLSGKIPAGIHVKRAVKRYLDDLERKDLEFRPGSVERVTDFISHLKHFTGDHNDHPFILQPWQEFIIANLYGFYWKDSGKRRFQTAYLEMARKQGKTALVAALCLYGLVADGEPAAEILLAANSKDQSKIAFNLVRGFAKSFDPTEKYLKKFRADVICPSNSGFIKCLASDSDKLDGYNCSLGIIDEYHSAPDSRIRDVIRSSMGMRRNPLLITVTTAGYDKTLPCYELRTVTSEIVSGIKKDDSFFGIIYSLDEDDDWKDEKNWIKANPNLGVTISKDFIRQQVQQAVNSPADEIGVKTKNLNIWCETETVWIQDEYLIKATKKLNIFDFRELDCYIGVDLSSNVDLTAVTYLFVRDGKYYFITNYYLPHESLKSRPDKDLYYQWHIHKFLKTTAGNVCDYDYILRDMLEVSENTSIIKVFYDKWNSLSWAVKATEEGLPLEPFSQAVGNFNGCTKEFERLIMGGEVVIDNNPITRYCFRCVELKFDWNGNCKPSKSNEKKKIDGVISMLQALAAYMQFSSKVGTGIY